MLYAISFQNVSMSERVKTFKWHLITTQITPIAQILVVCILNDLNMFQLYDYIVRSTDHVPFDKVSS